MILGIDHIEICVKDIDLAAEFFKNMGFTELNRTAHHGGAVEMRVPGDQNILIEFHRGLPTETPGLNHIAFLVDDMQQTVATLAEKGIEMDAPPKTSSNRGCQMASLRDPAHMRYQFTDLPSCK